MLIGKTGMSKYTCSQITTARENTRTVADSGKGGSYLGDLLLLQDMV